MLDGDLLGRFALGGLMFLAIMLVASLMRVRSGALVVVGVGRRKRWSWATLIVVTSLVLAYFLLSRAEFGWLEASVKLGLVTWVIALTSTGILLGESDWLTARWPKVWVKAIDFPYLVFAFFGLVLALEKSPKVVGGTGLSEVPGLMLLAVALGIRLSKTILEVFFDKHISGDFEWVDRRTLRPDDSATNER
jgi:hypothetical protein